MSQNINTHVSGILYSGIDNCSNINYVIRPGDYSCVASFIHEGTQYHFRFTFCQSQTGFELFQYKFHLVYHEEKHVQKFGYSSMGDNGCPVVNTTKEQKIAVIIQALEDIFYYLAYLCNDMEGQTVSDGYPPILQYAIWYIRHCCNDVHNYEECIQWLTCIAIVEQRFILPGIGVQPWKVIPFIARWAELDEEEQERRCRE